MAKQRKSSVNPITPSLSTVERASRNYLVNSRNLLGPTERLLRRDPNTARELDISSGLNILLTQSGDQTLEV